MSALADLAQHREGIEQPVARLGDRAGEKGDAGEHEGGNYKEVSDGGRS